MIEVVAVAIVVLAGLFLVTLGGAALLAPVRAIRFLNGFATSRKTHLIEMLCRAAAGAALVFRAPHMAFPDVFTVFGWAILVTTASLLLIPWQWHQRFAQTVLPRATHQITVLGIGSLGLGALILVAFILGGAG